jgi:hypothetical protein
MPTKETLVKILLALESVGGEVFVVGGPVRDALLGIAPKDIDFLVRKLTLEQIATAIRAIGTADEVGKSFGVVKGTVDGEVFDFAIPRIREVKTGVLHTDFKVETDPMATVESDLGRRDFTINAMALPLRSFIDRKLEDIIDPFSGMADLKDGWIRAVGDPAARFTEDPLRMLRGLQFSVRLGFKMEVETAGAILSMRADLKTVSSERILEEFKKAWLKGPADSGAFVAVLKLSGVGETLFGSDFKPLKVSLKGLRDASQVMGMLTAFFLLGGDVAVMKPEAVQIKFLEMAKKVVFGSEMPHTFIGNLKPLLPILLAVARESEKAFPGFTAKVEKMIATPLTAKELDITGEELIVALDIKSPKDGKRIGDAQRTMLSALWTGTLVNEKEKLLASIRQ